MSLPSPKKRIALLDAAVWPLDAALEWFDLPESFVVNDLAKQISKLMPKKGMVDRYLLERALQVHELVGMTWAALRHGLPRDAFRDKLRSKATPPGFHPGLLPFGLKAWTGTSDCYVLQLNQVEAWTRAWLPKDKVWSTLGARAKDLAQALDISTLGCAVSAKAGESKPAVATARCIATWDFVALHHSEASAVPKLVTLPPDRIGWHAIDDRLVSIENLWTDDLSRMKDYFRGAASSFTHQTP